MQALPPVSFWTGATFGFCVSVCWRSTNEVVIGVGVAP